MIVFDTETTGLPVAMNMPLDRQPHIIEFAAIKLDDDTLEEKDRIEFLCKPPISIPPIITNITGITDDKLKDEKPFSAYMKPLVNFFIGEKVLIAHNIDFDRKLLMFELSRMGMMTNFPWPPIHICTVEKTTFIKGHRLKLGELYEIATGNKIKDAHRAMNDVEALCASIAWLKAEGNSLR